MTIKPFLKKTVKLFLWLSASVILLIVALAATLQIPSVQNFVAGKITAILSKKTGTNVSVSRVGISFPKSVYISNFRVLDRKNDTLLHAGELKATIGMLALLQGEINIPELSLKNSSAYLSRGKNDSLYNFNFLIEAFAGDKKKNSKSEKGNTELNVGEVSLENIRFEINDQYGGMILKTHLSGFSAEFNSTDINTLNFDLAEVTVNGFNGTLTETMKKETVPTEKDTALPILSIAKIEVKQSNFHLINEANNESISVSVGEFNSGEVAVNLKQETINTDKIELSDSFAHLTMRSAADTIAKNIPVSESAEKTNNWTVTVKNVKLHNNVFKYRDPLQENEREKHFDPSNINLYGIGLNAHDIFYSPGLVQAEIDDIRMKSGNQFTIANLKMGFRMSEHSIEVQNFILNTERSQFSLNAKSSFKNIDQFRSDPGKVKIDINLKNINVFHPELTYFVPRLKKEKLFSENISTKLSAQVKGELEDLSVTKMNIETVSGTKVTGDINVRGLPDVKELEFNIPELTAQSVSTDVNLLAGGRIPETFNIPDSFTVDLGFTGTLKEFETSLILKSTTGNFSAEGEVSGNSYSLGADFSKFNIGNLIKKEPLIGIIDGSINIKGSGFDTNSVNAKVIADINQFTLNKYNYKNLNADVSIKQRSFRGTVSLKDEYAEFELSGNADLNKGQKHIDVNLDLKGADLRELHLVNQDLRVAFKAVADLSGNDLSSINGTAGITSIILSKGGKKYILDSLLFAAINEENNNSLSVKSAIVGIDYKGKFSPAKLTEELKRTFSTYFPLDTGATEKRSAQNFSLKLELNNHPVISEVFLPDLKAFDPGEISASFNSEEDKLQVLFGINRLHYGEFELEDFKANVSGEKESLSYNITAAKILNSDFRLDKFIAEGLIKDKTARTLITAKDEKGKQKISFRTIAEMQRKMMKVSLEEFALLGEPWNLSSDNYILSGPEGIQINNLQLSQNESSIQIRSEAPFPDSDIRADIKNLQLGDISRILQKDTVLISGNMNAGIILKRSNKSWGIISDAVISNLQFREIPLGTLKARARNTSENRFQLEAELAGEGNQLKADGYFMPAETGATIGVEVQLSPVKMKTIEAFSGGQINNTEGTVNGKLSIKGKVNAPEIDGELSFNEVAVNPVLMGSRLFLKNEIITIEQNKFRFKSFTLLDRNNQPAVINGSVDASNTKDIKFDLTLNTNNFLLLNTSKSNKSNYYGTLVVDSRIKLKGSPAHPVITSSIKLREKSYFTFAVPESKLSTDKGEGVVLFTDSAKFNRILTRNENIEKQKSSIKNFDISSTIETDKKAVLKLMIDPSSEDSLVVRGSGALGFALDPSGKISLTGLYTISDGTYMASMENLLRRKFKIEPGSTITWNGDPLDGNIDLRAFYTIRTSPVDLVADQIPPSERNQYRQRFPFLVYLKLKGALLTPDINFEIQLPPSDRGAMNGLLNARLEQLKEDPNALNKQVFALLVLGRFIQENPLETAGAGGTEAAARQTVGNFLSAQLNKFTARMVPGVDINFDVQSYDDYSGGNAQGRTEVGVGVSKQLFNDRVSVQVGGSVDVEGDKAKQNNASDIAGDVTVEYKLTKDGRYRIKGFRLNQYEGALEGQIIQTGAGLLYTRDFETWIQLISKEKKEKDNTGPNLESKAHEE